MQGASNSSVGKKKKVFKFYKASINHLIFFQGILQ